MLSEHVGVVAHLMSDEWKSFLSIGEAFAAHDTAHYSEREYFLGLVHANSAEGFNDRVHRVIAGVFDHISPRHPDLYFNEVGILWSQRVMPARAVRRMRKGREVVKPLWSRITPALQLPAVFKSAVGRQLRRTKQGSVQIPCAVAVFRVIKAAYNSVSLCPRRTFADSKPRCTYRVCEIRALTRGPRNQALAENTNRWCVSRQETLFHGG